MATRQSNVVEVGKGHVLPTTQIRVPMPKVSPPRDTAPPAPPKK